MSDLSRRDVLKLSTALLGGMGLSSMKPLSRLVRGFNTNDRPNFIILVLDAMSARNLSLLGYSRQTTSSFESIAQRSTIYHNHYAGGNFTTPGTATIFTGLYPWTHRALNIYGLIERSLERNNIFNYLRSGYTRIGFSQNQLTHLLLAQLEQDIDILMDRSSFSSGQNRIFLDDRFKDDPSIAYLAFEDFLDPSKSSQNPGSASLGLINILNRSASANGPTPEYPRGYPVGYHTQFSIEDVLAGLQKTAQNLSSRRSPFFAYFHLLPPHSPYNPRREFLEPFMRDKLTSPEKPLHPLSGLNMSPDKLNRQRILYDSFVSNVDFEVGNFVAGLDAAGILDSTYLIITSDHGEMFERGFYGHGSPLMYEPVRHIPLIIHAPRQTQRRDVYSLTSNADLVPTILYLAGRGIPAGLEGQVLPALGGIEDANRSVFTVYARENSAFQPLNTSVMSIRKSDYHLVHYRGYPGYDSRQELYHLGEDPDELHDLSPEDTVMKKLMLEELLDAANQADVPYQRKR